MTKNNRTSPDAVVSVVPTAAVIPFFPKPTVRSLMVRDSPRSKVRDSPAFGFTDEN